MVSKLVPKDEKRQTPHTSPLPALRPDGFRQKGLTFILTFAQEARLSRQLLWTKALQSEKEAKTHRCHSQSKPGPGSDVGPSSSELPGPCSHGEQSDRARPAGLLPGGRVMSPGGGEKQEQMWFLIHKDSKSGISGRKPKGSQN